MPIHTPPPPQTIPTPHVPHPPRNRQAQDHPPRITTTDRHEEPPRTTHDAPPPTTHTTPTQAPSPQPTASPATARQHTVVPPWMRYTPKTPLSQPTRGHHGTHQGDTAGDPTQVRPRHSPPAGSLPRTDPTPVPIAPPHRGNNTRQPHTATRHPRALHRGHNTPKMLRRTGPRTPQRW